MIEALPINSEHNSEHTIMNMITKLDPKAAIVVGGMLCITAIVCVGFVVLSGDEMDLTKNGLSIKQP